MMAILQSILKLVLAWYRNQGGRCAHRWVWFGVLRICVHCGRIHGYTEAQCVEDGGGVLGRALRCLEDVKLNHETSQLHPMDLTDLPDKIHEHYSSAMCRHSAMQEAIEKTRNYAGAVLEVAGCGVPLDTKMVEGDVSSPPRITATNMVSTEEQEERALAEAIGRIFKFGNKNTMGMPGRNYERSSYHESTTGILWSISVKTSGQGGYRQAEIRITGLGRQDRFGNLSIVGGIVGGLGSLFGL